MSSKAKYQSFTQYHLTRAEEHRREARRMRERGSMKCSDFYEQEATYHDDQAAYFRERADKETT